MGAGPEQAGFSPFDIYITTFHDEEKPPSGFEAFSTRAVACYESSNVSISPLFLFLNYFQWTRILKNLLQPRLK